MTATTLTCPQCGEPMESLIEGYCPDCHRDNYDRLLLHNIQYDEWQRKTPAQRESAIRWAMR